jgi:hypothetical protein
MPHMVDKLARAARILFCVAALGIAFLCIGYAVIIVHFVVKFW